MKEKIIALIKKYQAESKSLQDLTGRYTSWTDRSASITLDRCANDLKELISHPTGSMQPTPKAGG